MEPKQQIIRLVRIQELALEIRAGRATVEGAPGRLEEAEQRFRERNAEYVEVKDRFDDLERDNRERNSELGGLEETRKKFMDDLMGVQNQREYAAMLKEIDTVKAKISEHEDAVLSNMEELETLKGELESHTSHIEEERKIVEKERRDVEFDVASARSTIARATDERERLEAEVPDDLVGAVGRVEGSRQGVFLAEVEDAVCKMCFVRVRPQVFQEIKLAAKIHACSSCRRFLYFPATIADDLASLAAEAAPADVPAGDPEPVAAAVESDAPAEGAAPSADPADAAELGTAERG